MYYISKKYRAVALRDDEFYTDFTVFHGENSPDTLENAINYASYVIMSSFFQNNCLTYNTAVYDQFGTYYPASYRKK